VDTGQGFRWSAVSTDNAQKLLTIKQLSVNPMCKLYRHLEGIGEPIAHRQDLIFFSARNFKNKQPMPRNDEEMAQERFTD
jgi:hypothetical protein